MSLTKWSQLSARTRNRLAHDAYCRVGSEQGYCADCGVAFRGLSSFDRGLRADLDRCIHMELIEEGVLDVLEWREIDGIQCPRAGVRNTEQVFA